MEHGDPVAARSRAQVWPASNPLDPRIRTASSAALGVGPAVTSTVTERFLGSMVRTQVFGQLADDSDRDYRIGVPASPSRTTALATERSFGEADLGDRRDDRFARREGSQRTSATSTLGLRALLASAARRLVRFVLLEDAREAATRPRPHGVGVVRPQSAIGAQGGVADQRGSSARVAGGRHG